jgi:ketosteroid isomerase-like protein
VSSEDENKALARRFLEAFANGDLGTLDELLAPDFINRWEQEDDITLHTLRHSLALSWNS